MAKDVAQKKKDFEEVKKKEEEIETGISELEERIKDWDDKYKRVLADYQNLEKRIQEEKREWIKLANKELITRLLPVLDTLVLANQHTGDQNIQVTLSQFLDTLKSEGVEKIETVGKEFDPHVMEAIDTVEVDPSTGSGQEDGKVVEEVRPGYKIQDKLLRPAQVRVGKKATS